VDVQHHNSNNRRRNLLHQDLRLVPRELRGIKSSPTVLWADIADSSWEVYSLLRARFGTVMSCLYGSGGKSIVRRKLMLLIVRGLVYGVEPYERDGSVTEGSVYALSRVL